MKMKIVATTKPIAINCGNARAGDGYWTDKAAALREWRGAYPNPAYYTRDELIMALGGENPCASILPEQRPERRSDKDG